MLLQREPNAFIAMQSGYDANKVQPSIVMDLVQRWGVMKRDISSTPPNLGLFSFDAHVLGGALIGLGMAVTGSCPGTSFVQAGTGSLHGALVVLGGLLGGITFVSLTRARAKRQPQTAEDPPHPEVSGTQSKTPLDIATALGIPPFVLLLIWVPMCLAVMRIAFAKDRSQPSLPNPGLVPPAYGGLLIGLAQLVTILLTGHAIGASSGYEDVARWLEGKLVSGSPKVEASRKLLTGPVMFAAGIVCSAAIQNYLFGSGRPLSNLEYPHMSTLLALRAVAGGWAMVLGARVARGCTSGHGISGLSKFSLPSLVTTASMFGMCIATAAALKY